jgi:hypothetical protein
MRFVVLLAAGFHCKRWVRVHQIETLLLRTLSLTMQSNPTLPVTHSCTLDEQCVAVHHTHCRGQPLDTEDGAVGALRYASGALGTISSGCVSYTTLYI